MNKLLLNLLKDKAFQEKLKVAVVEVGVFLVKTLIETNLKKTSKIKGGKLSTSCFFNQKNSMTSGKSSSNELLA